MIEPPGRWANWSTLPSIAATLLVWVVRNDAIGASLRGREEAIAVPVRRRRKRRRPRGLPRGLHGGAKRSRTADLLNAIQALYQLSYSPEPFGRIAGVLVWAPGEAAEPMSGPDRDQARIP